MNKEFLYDIINYKTKKCTNTNCQITKDYTQLYNNCFYYHNKNDKRRSPINYDVPENEKVVLNVELNVNEILKYIDYQVRENVNLPKNDQNIERIFILEYSNYLIDNFNEFILKENISKHDKIFINKNNSLNLVESLYHPLNYKKVKCLNYMESSCNEKYCFKYHNQIEYKSYKMLNKFIKNYDNIFKEEISFIKKIDRNTAEIVDMFYKQKKKHIVEKNSKNNNNENTVKKLKKFTHNKNKPSLYYKVEKSKKNFFKKEQTYANTSNKFQFYIDQNVPFFEDLNNEFKHFLNLEIQNTLNYICGFLNSNGGKLFYGINDEGKIKGINVTKNQKIDFRKDIENGLKNFDPIVPINALDIKFHEICTDSSYENIIKNKYIVEIKAKEIERKEYVFLNNNNDLYIKRFASLNLLSNQNEIKDYCYGKLHEIDNFSWIKTLSKNELLNLKNELNGLIS